MARPPATVITRRQAAGLRSALDALMLHRDDAARVAADPIRVPRRYTDPADQEIAAIFASALGYGRVAAFMPVVEGLMAQADAVGGPRAWVEGFAEADIEAVRPIVYRWNRGVDLALLALALQEVLQEWDSIGALFAAHHRPEHATIRPALTAAVARLRDAALAAAPKVGLSAQSFSALPRGLRTLLSSPAGGSACKRWNMLLRWMVRTGSPDLGIWKLPTAALILPLDTHTHKLAWLTGLTQRTDGSWRTAAEITANLARLDPDDPTRYDFALAHLGISGACRKERVVEICGSCPMKPVCRIGGAR